MPEKQIIAKKINDWLNACVDESGAFFLNTIEAGRPKSRPISFHMLKDGVNYFGVGAMKEVYRQIPAGAILLAAWPNIEGATGLPVRVVAVTPK